jgi:NDP-sugar pyrophosphorylase family protein
MKVIILAAGKGTRLLPLTSEVPKPLISIGNETILDNIFKNLPDEIDEVIIVVKHLKEKIIKHVSESFEGKKVYIVEQGEKTGTFGSLWYTKDLLKENERFLVINGDDMHDRAELSKHLEFPRSFGIQKMIMPNYYSIEVTNNGLIEGFKTQTEEEKAFGTFIATGVYVLDKKIFDHDGIVVSGGELGLPQTILAQKDLFPTFAVITEKWIPVNSFEDLEKAKQHFSSK